MSEKRDRGHNYGRDPMLPRGTQRCRCPTCGLYFASGFAFAGHRIGRVGTPDRRCLAEAELLARGWAQNVTGHWVTHARPAALPQDHSDEPTEP